MKSLNSIKYSMLIAIYSLLSFVNINRANAQDFNLVNKVVASDRGGDDQFGVAVAISDNYAIVGAYNEDGIGLDSIHNAGAAYIYTKSASGAWVEMQKLVASDRDSIDAYFGAAVAISGNYAIVGSYGDGDTIGASNTTYLQHAGSAYIFERNTATGIWEEKQKIVAIDRQFRARFGYAVAISKNFAVVGAKDFGPGGAAYVFERGSSGWGNTQKITSNSSQSGDLFGTSVAIYGNHIAVGSPEDDILLKDRAGSAYVFEQDGSGIWNETQKIVPSDSDTNSYFGFSVSISDSSLLVGAYNEDFADTSGNNYIENAGAAYVFEKTNGIWQQQQKIVASDRLKDDHFGWSVSISGNLALISARRADLDETGINYMPTSGAAYIYLKTGTTWNEIDKITSSHREPYGYFGNSVAISDSSAIVGAYWEDNDSSGTSPLTRAGSACIFEVCDIDNATILLSKGIRADDTLASSYQWIDCANNDTLIPGATSHTFYPAFDGHYAVIIQKNTCVDTSACVAVVLTGISEEKLGNSVNIYPNPANEQLYIDLGEIKGEKVSLIDITGKTIYSSAIVGKQKVNIPLQDYDNGIYFVNIESNNQSITYKVVVLHE